MLVVLGGLVHELAAWSDREVLLVGSDHVTNAELVGFVSGLAGVWLTVREHISNFPVGLVNSAFFLLLFADSRLYADATLQVVYLVLGMCGWWSWSRRRESGRVRAVAPMGARRWLFTAVGVFVALLALYDLLSHTGDSAPFLDATTTALSLAAQWQLNAYRIGTWALWAAADVIYVPLYVTRHLWLTAIVYVVFLGLTGAGARAWRASWRAHAQPGAVLAETFA